MAFLLALLSLWFGGVPDCGSAVERVDLGSDRVSVALDGRLAAAAAVLVAPAWRPAVPVDDHVATGGGGAQVTFDVSRPALSTDAPPGVDVRVLTLRLATADDDLFARAAAKGRIALLPPLNRTGPDGGEQAVTMAVPPASPPLALPQVAGDPGRPLVVIDPGHGGMDPGAISPTSGLREKDVTLKIARAIRAALLKSGRVRVALTRDDDRFLVLQERYGIARKLHADLFISIHCDSVGEGDATGASVYTLSEVASDKEAARLAARENRADLISGVDLGGADADVSSILIDLTQRETMNASAAFAALLGREARTLVPMKPQFHRFASLVVLKAPDIPSVLFETGYISNPADAAFLDSDAGRQRIAQAVERAVAIDFARRSTAN